MGRGEPLDNPIWAALHSAHAQWALGDASAVWYPLDVGPFAAVPHDDAPLSPDALTALRERPEAVHFIGALPARPAHVAVTRSSVLQMICDRSPSEAPNEPPDLRLLTEADTPAMLDLMSRVYPGYYRRRTGQLGTYWGVFEADRLAAMGGERFFLASHRELSGIVTDPSAAGRGYARAIISRLVESLVHRGISPFLHVAPDNTRAIAIYRAMGFAPRAELPLLTIERRAENGAPS
jgi:ribosomal protein S18 acetylase RimI-like enzyme